MLTVNAYSHCQYDKLYFPCTELDAVLSKVFLPIKHFLGMSGCRMTYLGQAALQANQSEVLQAIQQKK